MKKYYLNIVAAGILVSSLLLYACKEQFLEQKAKAALLPDDVTKKRGVEALLVGAYSLLDGIARDEANDNNIIGSYGSSGSNWIYGSVVGGDAHKGSDPGDQSPITAFPRFEPSPTNDFLNDKWKAVYNGIDRVNQILKLLPDVQDATDADKTRITAEARFLRGHYYFEAKKMWNMVPYVDESVDYLKGNYKVPNDKSIWPLIEADLKFAYDSLAESGMEIGRVNKWAAAAFLAKCYMFQKNYTDAKPLLEAIISSGVNQQGVKYALNAHFHDSFDADTRNSAESIFAVQYSVNDGSNGSNAGYGDILNYPYNGGPGTCCGFFQPTQELVNSYRTNGKGLPLLDGTYNTKEVVNDQGLQSGDDFTPDKGNLDPRLDWTVGRRSIPYLDWGPHPGNDWIRDQNYSGPYSPKKNVYSQAQEGKKTDISYWTNGLSANNYILIRYADVLLWAAECEVETGSLDQARAYVDSIRARAANPDGWVKTYVDPTDPGQGFTDTPAANYVIGLYSDVAGTPADPFTSQASARTAVHFERKLELAMEGHRFFDIVRWNEAATTLTAYLAYESKKRIFLAGTVFTPGKNEYFPIPQRQIDLTGITVLKQNPGY